MTRFEFEAALNKSSKIRLGAQLHCCPEDVAR